MKYLAQLPTVSVIFPFHNEVWHNNYVIYPIFIIQHNSTLLRSVHSILNRSPPELIKQIILVDDASTKKFLKAPLDQYCAQLSNKIQVIHTTKREGLIRARQIGIEHATADIVVILDAHSEANYNWLPPLIEPIAIDYRWAKVVSFDTFDAAIISVQLCVHWWILSTVRRMNTERKMKAGEVRFRIYCNLL